MLGPHYEHLFVVDLSLQLSACLLDLVHPAFEGLSPNILRVSICVLHMATGPDQGLHVSSHVTEGLLGPAG